ncbi:MAG: hypothetical protein Q4A24_09430 [Akkermansia sp.]|nr:hypothetical protein [Akkermansia sp.]
MMDRHYGIKIGAKNYYLCVVLDWASREVLGRSLSDNIGVERFCRDFSASIQNRAKNGLTDHSSLCYKTLVLIRAKKQEEMACSSQKEGDSLFSLFK